MGTCSLYFRDGCVDSASRKIQHYCRIIQRKKVLSHVEAKNITNYFVTKVVSCALDARSIKLLYILYESVSGYVGYLRQHLLFGTLCVPWDKH